jgi:methionyl aminopeptidase
MSRAPRLSPAEGDAAYAAARCVVQTHERLVNFVKVGHTLAHIDAEVTRIFRDLRCKSCFLGYKVGRLPPFPSHACLSLNDCIVHGTAGYVTRPIQPGDLLKVDIGVWLNGWIGDAAWSYAVKEVSDENRRLMACGKESLRRGIAEMKPGEVYLKFAQAVQGHVERECGFHCVRGLGGHGIGRKLHGRPFVANVVPSFTETWTEATWQWEPGTLVAVEPMLAVGTGKTKQGDRAWPVFTADGSASVHYEADVLVTEKGPWDLTEGMAGLPEVIG